LCILPLCFSGPGNEMTMRGAIAPLAILALLAGIGVARGPAAWRRRTLGALLLRLLAPPEEHLVTPTNRARRWPDRRDFP